jgi:urate oxidase
MTTTEISYGKAHVVFYRLGGSDMMPLAASVDIDVVGKRFLAAYTEGDNRDVVATDTMKNFVYAMAAEYGGRTLLGLCAFLGRRFLTTYPVMESLRVTAREVPLDPAAGERGPSEVLFRSTRTEGAFAQVALDAIDGQPEVTAEGRGRRGTGLPRASRRPRRSRAGLPRFQQPLHPASGPRDGHAHARGARAASRD